MLHNMTHFTNWNKCLFECYIVSAFACFCDLLPQYSILVYFLVLLLERSSVIVKVPLFPVVVFILREWLLAKLSNTLFHYFLKLTLFSHLLHLIVSIIITLFWLKLVSSLLLYYHYLFDFNWKLASSLLMLNNLHKNARICVPTKFHFFMSF